MEEIKEVEVVEEVEAPTEEIVESRPTPDVCTSCEG